MSKNNTQLLQTKIIDKELTYDLRKRVLWPHINNNDYTITVDNTASTFHLGTLINQKIISIGTFIQENNSEFKSKKQYRLRAMATDHNYQKIGAGKSLMLQSFQLLKEKKIDILWCSARLKAIPFYRKLNMNSLEKTYHITNIGPHQTMYIDLDMI
tara:strand:+ start:457 stop:924 length:468 start_codon:yes stop_codon:yes gene_type:complete